MANHHTRAVPELSDDEHRALQRWVRRRKTAQALAMRARIVLACAEGVSDQAVAERLGTTRITVGKWRRRFLEKGCDGLLDEPRPGAPRTVGDEDVERVITLTLESMPRGATHWSTRSMAKKSGLSSATVGRIWRAFALQPHRDETFKLSKDPLFIEKVRDIVGLYMAPPERAVVLCIDEKSQIQALDRIHAPIPGPSGAAHPRLSAQRHHLAVRRPRHRYRRSHRQMLSPSPFRRVPQVPRHRRQGRAEGLRRPPCSRQLRHPQDRDDPQLAGTSAALPSPFHADQCLLAQSGRTLVRRNHAPDDPSRLLSEHACSRNRNQGVSHGLQ